MTATGGIATAIGRAVEGRAEVLLTNGKSAIRAGRLESERFAVDSWFKEGIEAYMRRLREFHIP